MLNPATVYFFQQADTVRVDPFSTEEEKVISSPVDTSQKVSHSQKTAAKKKKQIASEATLKEENHLPPLPDSIKLPEQAVINSVPKKEIPHLSRKIEDHFDYSDSIFKNHLLQAADIQPKILVRQHQYWLSGTIFFAFCIFVMVSAFYNKGLGRLTAVFSGGRSISQLFRGEYSLRSRTSILLTLLFLSVVSVFIYQSISYLRLAPAFPVNEFIIFLIIFLVLALAYFIKITFVKLCGYIFNLEGLFKEYIFSLFIFNEILGLFLLPVIISFAFVTLFNLQYIFLAGVCLIGLVLVARLLWVTYNGMSTAGISKSYLFLYLCALEILPLLVLIKIISRKIL